MAFSRYARTKSLTLAGGKKIVMCSKAYSRVNKAVKSGRLQSSQQVLKQGSRLDTISADVYGDAIYWWVIAAASGIGWQCQVPPGTVLRIPHSLDAVSQLVA